MPGQHLPCREATPARPQVRRSRLSRWAVCRLRLNLQGLARRQDQEQAARSRRGPWRCLWTQQGQPRPGVLPVSTPGPPLVLWTSPLAQTQPLWATSARCGPPVAMLRRDLGCPGRRPHFLSQEPPAPAVAGQPVVITSSPFLLRAGSPGPRPQSCRRAARRPASPSQTPSPGSPQGSGPPSLPGPGEAGPQDLRILSKQPLALCPSELSPLCQASCQLLARASQGALQRAGLPLPPAPASWWGSQLLPMVLDVAPSAGALPPCLPGRASAQRRPRAAPVRPRGLRSSQGHAYKFNLCSGHREEPAPGL